MLKATHRLITLSLVFLFVTSPLLAQQRRGAPAKKPAATETPEPVPTFDTLLAADSYKIYCEVRGVGGLIRSSAVNDLLDPVMKLGGPPKEFKAMVKWLSAHADVLASSRMLVAGWASRPNIPDVVVAIEFSSPEEAKKFYPELRDFMPTLLPTPTPAPSTSPLQPGENLPAPKPDAPSTIDADDVLVPATPQETKSGPGAPATPALPPYLMKLAGSLILISPTEFKFRSLRPRNSKPLEEDQNFNLARNRFASESLFLYVDLKSIEKEDKERRKKYEEEAKKYEEEAKQRAEAEAANPHKVEEPENEEPGLPNETMKDPLTMQTPDPSDPSQPTLQATVVDPQASGEATLSAQPRPDPDVINPLMFSLYGALFGVESKWPEAVAAAVVFEGDAYVLRTLILNSPANKNTAIPFAPQFISGPALAPESPNIFPSDTELFVSVSLDYPQVYEGMVKALAPTEEQFKQIRTRAVNDAAALESPITLFEKKLGLKIRDDLMPLLGNELALALPKTAPVAKAQDSGPQTLAAERSEPKAKKAAEPQPVIAIAVKDREAVGRLIPKIIEAIGFKGANIFAQTEKRDGTEITSYANFFSYAFVDNFLVVSPDPLATRKVVDAYLNHDTLSSNSHFKNFTRWQPRQVLGQLYVAPGLIEQYAFGAGGVNDKMNEYLSRVNPVIDPLTYSLTNDGQGPLHELHVPKNLLQLLIAGASSETSRPPLETNESLAQSALRSIAGSEAMYKSDNAEGRYASLEELLSESLIPRELIENHGYRTALIVSGNNFEATAVPIDYGTTGRLSYFIDESGVLRAGDHGGGAATVADQPVD